MIYLAVAAAYLLVLFAIAAAVERGLVSARIVRHPLTPALALGVYASSWSYYGSVGFARSSGLSFLAIYLGPTLACMLVPVLWEPVRKLVAERQLGSLADLFAFRYRSTSAGPLVTVFTLAGSVPYLAQQIRAVADSLHAVGVPGSPLLLGGAFTLVVALFALLFGARHVTPRARHRGLVVAIAASAVVTLLAILAVGAFAVFGVLESGGGMSGFLARQPQALDALARPVREGPWLTLLFLSFGAAFLLPRQFHLAFAEGGGTLRTASWAFPLYLLLLNLPIVPILWAGTALDPAGDADLYVLAVSGAAGPWLRVLAFVGGLSAASAMLVVTSLALGAMAVNHLVLPVLRPGPRRDLYAWLRWIRRAVIAAILGAALAAALVVPPQSGRLVDFGLISFVATAQLVPGLLALLFWPRATGRGFVWGLSAGMLAWLVTLVIPQLARGGLLPAALDIATAMGFGGDAIYTLATLLSVGANAFVLAALSTREVSDRAELEAARACRSEASALAALPAASSASDFAADLAPFVGEPAAREELRRALDELGLDPAERRPAELARLRERIEQNLSGLMGPLLARFVVGESLRLDPGARLAVADHFRLLEERLRTSDVRLDGLAAELDGARRWLRGILEELPLGACVLQASGEIVLVNRTFCTLVGRPAATLAGARIADLPERWRAVLAGQAASDGDLAIHRAALAGGGSVLLVEDRTERRTLERQLVHAERLASIGRFAAGVAHEVGNPLTGISLLAQNLEHEDDWDGVRERAALIRSESRRIEEIVRTLVTFSHGETLDRPHAFAAVDAAALADEALTLVRLHERAKQIVLRAEVQPGLVLHGDRQRLLQVLVNLLANACDASPPGSSVIVRGSIRAGGAELEVVDAGTGIAQADFERLFEPFFTTKEPGRGTGLGLSIVYGIVREHGGDIAVESVPGKGTTFRLRLPAAAKGAA